MIIHGDSLHELTKLDDNSIDAVVSDPPYGLSNISHGALMCKTCNALWNRDENSSRNIYKIAYNAINKKERPNYLCRSKKVENDLIVRSDTSSVCRLQCNSLEFTQPKFT